MSKTSPQSVLDSYFLQFQKDFSQFLKSRSEEVVLGGRMVLSFMGRRSMDPTTEESCHHFELLAHALMSMVSEVQTCMQCLYIALQEISNRSIIL
jgi:jasmonate O-methyltransferase